jgi:dynein intermediate chain
MSPKAASRSRPGSTVSSRPLSGQRLSSGSGGPSSEIIPHTSTSSAVYVTTSTQTFTTSPLSTVQIAPSEVSQAQPRKTEVITYEKSTQTSNNLEPLRSRGQGTDEWVDDGVNPEQRAKELEKIRLDLRKEVEEEVRATLDTTKISSGESKNDQERFPLRTLTEEEREAVLTSKEFRDFVDTSTRVIDRALDEQYDILIDYTQGSGEIDEDDDGYGKGRSRRGRRVKQVAQYWDERRSKKRMISDICFSPKVSNFRLCTLCYTKPMIVS